MKEKLKKFLKKHSRTILIWELVLLIFGLIILIISFENKDKKQTYHTISNINIVDDKFDLKKDIYFGSASRYIDNTHYISFTSSNSELYYSALPNISRLEDGHLNSYRVNLQSLKTNLLSYNSSVYSVDLSTLTFLLNIYIDSYINGNSYYRVYSSYNNNASPNFLSAINSDILLNLQFVESDYYSLSINLNFDYQYLDIFYYENLMYEQDEEINTNIISYSIYNNDMPFIYQQLQNENNNLNENIIELNNQISSLEFQYNQLDFNYQTLLDQYNLISQNDYTFSELFWSISAVPFGVLTSTFNVNVMGVNLALNYNGFINIYGVIMAYKETF